MDIAGGLNQKRNKPRFDEPKVKRIRDFSGGINNKFSPFLLSDNEVQDMQNFHVEEKGTLSTRKGYVRHYPEPFSNAPVNSLFNFRKDDGSSRLVMASGGRLYYDTPHFQLAYRSQADWDKGQKINLSSGEGKITLIDREKHVAKFVRKTPGYLDGQKLESDAPRLADARFGKGLVVERGTKNLILPPYDTLEDFGQQKILFNSGPNTESISSYGYHYGIKFRLNVRLKLARIGIKATGNLHLRLWKFSTQERLVSSDNVASPSDSSNPWRWVDANITLEANEDYLISVIFPSSGTVYYESTNPELQPEKVVEIPGIQALCDTRHFWNSSTSDTFPSNQYSGTTSLFVAFGLEGYSESEIGVNGATVSPDTTEHWQGASSLKVECPGSSAEEGVATYGIKVFSNRVYTASVYIKGPSGSSVKMKVQKIRADGSVEEEVEGSPRSISTNWSRIQHTFTTGLDTRFVKVLVVTTSAQAITFYVDAYQVEEGPYATSWTPYDRWDKPEEIVVNPVDTKNVVNVVIRAVAYHNGLYIAAGNSAFKSRDGINWERINFGFSVSTSFYAVKFLNGMWYLGGTNGVIVRSPDGETWENVTPSFTEIVRDFEYANGLYVAVGGTRIRTSTDGANWVSRLDNSSYYFTGIKHYGGRWIIVSYDGYILTSTNDLNTITTLYSSPAGADFYAVDCQDGVWLAVGANFYRTSTDGVTWTPHKAIVPDTSISRVVYKVVYLGDGRWLGAGYSRIYVYDYNTDSWTIVSSRDTADLFGICPTDAPGWYLVGANSAPYLREVINKSSRAASEEYTVELKGNTTVQDLTILGRFKPLWGSDLESVSWAQFARSSIAYLSDGTQVASGVPRFEAAKFGQGLLIEEATTNLLTANQSSVETDLTGFGTVGTGVTIARSSDWAHHGSWSLKVTGARSVSDCATLQAINYTSGQPYVFRARVYNPNSQPITVRVRQYGGAVSSEGSVTVDPGEEADLFSASGWTALDNVSTTIRLWEDSGLPFHIDSMQQENRAYPTSWTLGRTTRAADQVYATLPQPLPQEFTAMGWFVPDWAHTIPESFSGRVMTIFEATKATPTLRDRLALFYRPSTGRFEFQVIAGGSGPLVASDAAVSMRVAVGAGGTILTSPDGINWTSRAIGTTNHLYNVAYGGGMWVVVGQNGTILTSTDGINWTSRSSGTTTNLLGVAYGGGMWVVVGLSGTILTSPDGTTWTARSGTTQDLRGVAYGGGMWVVVGQNGTILTSTDGITWTARTSGTTRYLRGVAYGGGLYVAVGDTGTILTSPDGVNWTSRTSGVSQNLWGVVYDGGMWVAVGYSGTILTSPDGINWTSRSSGTTENLYGIAYDYDGGMWVAVGAGGTIRTSTDGITWTSRSGVSQDLYGIAYGGGLLPGFNSGDPIAWAIRHDATGIRLSLKIGTTIKHYFRSGAVAFATDLVRAYVGRIGAVAGYESNGIHDDVVVLGRALSDAEVEAFFTRGREWEPDEDTMLYLPFNGSLQAEHASELARVIFHATDDNSNSLSLYYRKDFRRREFFSLSRTLNAVTKMLESGEVGVDLPHFTSEDWIGWAIRQNVDVVSLSIHYKSQTYHYSLSDSSVISSLKTVRVGGRTLEDIGDGIHDDIIAVKRYLTDGEVESYFRAATPSQLTEDTLFLIPFNSDVEARAPVSGEWISDEIDITQVSDKTSGFIVDSPSLPGGSSRTIYTQTSDDKAVWSPYEPLGPGGTIQSPAGNYLRVRIVFLAEAGATMPSVSELRIQFDDEPSVTELASGFDPNARWRFASYQNVLWMVNGSNTNKKWDGNTFADMGGNPPVAPLILVHKNRGFLARGTRIYFSDLGNMESWPALNFIDVGPGDGDQITGWAILLDSIAIFKENSIWLLQGDSPSNFTLRRVIQGTGAVSGDSLVFAKNTIGFLYRDGYYFFDGVRTQIASDKVDKSFKALNQRQLALTTAVVWDNKVYLAAPEGNANYNNVVLVFDLLRVAWTVYRGINAASWVIWRRYNEDVLLFGDSTKGQVYEAEIGYNDDGKPIEAYVVTKADDFGAAEVMKLIRSIFLAAKETNNLDTVVEVSFFKDLGPETAPITIPITRELEVARIIPSVVQVSMVRTLSIKITHRQLDKGLHILALTQQYVPKGLRQT